MQLRPLALVLFLSITIGCSPGQPSQGGGSTQQAQPSGPKTLTIGLLREPATIDGFTGQGGSRGGAGETGSLVHNLLTVQDPFENDVPQLAAELPSVERGTWTVNPDGSMVITWKLHPNIRWHDGTPFTADDVLFS